MTTLAGSMRGSCNEAAKFALCYGPMKLLALLHGCVEYHYAGKQPIPATGLHRLDKQPYSMRSHGSDKI
jgi:hypothetical protein